MHPFDLFRTVGAWAVFIALALIAIPACSSAFEPDIPPPYPAPPPVPTAVIEQAAVQLAPAAAPVIAESAMIRAWWSPGGEPITIAVDAIVGPIAGCPAYPDLILVTLADGPQVWVRWSEAGLMNSALETVPPAGGVCEVR